MFLNSQIANRVVEAGASKWRLGQPVGTCSACGLCRIWLVGRSGGAVSRLPAGELPGE